MCRTSTGWALVVPSSSRVNSPLAARVTASSTAMREGPPSSCSVSSRPTSRPNPARGGSWQQANRRGGPDRAPPKASSPRAFADGALLVHEASGRMLVTDAIGSLVWPLLNGRKSSAHIVSELAGRWFDGTSVDRIASDFNHWIAALVDLGFVDQRGRRVIDRIAAQGLGSADSGQGGSREVRPLLRAPAAAARGTEDSEYQLLQDALEQCELADRLGFDYVWEVEHHFLEEYCHSSAPEVFLAAVSQRTKHIRLGHGIVQTPPPFNHPARVAERIATLDLVSDGRVDFGTGESSSEAELGGFLHRPRAEARDVGGGPARRAALHDRGAVHRARRASSSRCRRATSSRSRARSRTRRCGSRAAAATRSTSRRRRASARSRSRSSTPRRRATGSTTTTRRSRTRACRSATPSTRTSRASRRSCATTTRTRRSRRGLEGANFFGYSLAHYYVFGRHQPGRDRRVGRVPARSAPSTATTPRRCAAAARARRPARRQGRAGAASAASAARSARPTRSASTCAATRSAASTR